MLKACGFIIPTPQPPVIAHPQIVEQLLIFFFFIVLFLILLFHNLGLAPDLMWHNQALKRSQNWAELSFPSTTMHCNMKSARSNKYFSSLGVNKVFTEKLNIKSGRHKLELSLKNSPGCLMENCNVISHNYAKLWWVVRHYYIGKSRSLPILGSHSTTLGLLTFSLSSPKKSWKLRFWLKL